MKKIQMANGKNYKMQTPQKLQKKKIKKALKPKDFFNFLFPLVMEIFPWIMGKFPQKNMGKN
jgi:hypothetical protein